MPWELRACDNANPQAGLGALPDRAGDVVLTDPPCSPRVHACSRRGIAGYRDVHGEEPTSAACATWASHRS